jgi:hypothetical protein
MRASAVAAVLGAAAASVLFALGAGCPGPEDEAAARARERAEVDARLGSAKVTLYRVAKTAVRSLPPRASVRALASGRAELTREEWAALLAASPDPALARHRTRVGLFIVGAHLREAATAGAVVGAAVLAAKGGGRLTAGAEGQVSLAAGAPGGDGPSVTGAAGADLWQLPRTGSPFASPVAFVGECRELLDEDEDRFPTLVVSVLPEDLQRAAAARAAPFDAPPLDRVPLAAFEHLALGAAWLALEPSLALYELRRSEPGRLGAPEEVVLRAARATLYMKSEWRYQALDELDAAARRVPEVATASAALSGGEVAPAEAEAAVLGLLHIVRAENYLALGRKEDADRELAAASAKLEGKARLRGIAHLLAAKVHLDRGEYGRAAAEARLAAEAAPAGPEREELLALAAEIEKELPASTAPLDLVRFAGRRALEEAARIALGERVGAWAKGFRDRADAQVKEWEASFPSTDELRAKADELWSRLRR